MLSRKASAALNAVSEEPTTVETAFASTTSADPATQQPQLTPAATSSTNESDWSLYEDPASGHVFWYNTVTQVSQWDCHFALPTPSEHDEGAYDDAAHKVHNEDDLGI